MKTLSYSAKSPTLTFMILMLAGSLGSYIRVANSLEEVLIIMRFNPDYLLNIWLIINIIIKLVRCN